MAVIPPPPRDGPPPEPRKPLAEFQRVFRGGVNLQLESVPGKPDLKVLVARKNNYTFGFPEEDHGLVVDVIGELIDPENPFYPENEIAYQNFVKKLRDPKGPFEDIIRLHSHVNPSEGGVVAVYTPDKRRKLLKLFLRVRPYPPKQKGL